MARWPIAPPVAYAEPERGASAICIWPVEVVEPTVKCKHCSGGCELCGTTDRRDVMHTTVRGRGKVARIKRP